MEKTAGLSCEINGGAVVNKASADEVQCEIALPGSLEAPVLEGEKVGSVIYKIGGDAKSFDVVSTDEIEKTSFGLVFGRIFHSLIAL